MSAVSYCRRCGHQADQHGALPPGCVHYDKDGPCRCPLSCFDVDADRDGAGDADDAVPRPVEPVDFVVHPNAPPFQMCRKCGHYIGPDGAPLPERPQGEVLVPLAQHPLCKSCEELR